MKYVFSYEKNALFTKTINNITQHAFSLKQVKQFKK